jgi:hypothetical protein
MVEHPFGTLKRGMQQCYFLCRGLTKVCGAMSLAILAYNLKRVFNLVRSEADAGGAGSQKVRETVRKSRRKRERGNTRMNRSA